MSLSEPIQLVTDVHDIVGGPEDRVAQRRAERPAATHLDLADLIDEIVDHEGVATPRPFAEDRSAPTASVFYGAAGVGLALVELAARCGRSEWLDLARSWAERAVRSTDSNAFYAEEFFGCEQRPDPRSFHHGQAGPHIAVAASAALQGDVAALTRSVETIARIAPSAELSGTDPGTAFDATVGPVSLLTGLSGLAELLDVVADECTSRRRDANLVEGLVVNDVRRELRSLIEQELKRLDVSIVSLPLRDHALANIGAAHGWSGLLDAVLRSTAAIGSAPPAWVLDRADELAHYAHVCDERAYWPISTRSPIGSSGGWCNGSAGQVSMWSRLYAATGDERHLDLARGSAAATAAEPSPVHNLCCGSSGKVLSSLTVFQATGDQRWLEEAETCLREAARLSRVRSSPVSRPDRIPLSAYKGDLGVAIAAAALIDPDQPVRFFH